MGILRDGTLAKLDFGERFAPLKSEFDQQLKEKIELNKRIL